MKKNNTASNHLLEQHRSPPEGMVFYESLSDIRADHAPAPYLHLVSRAWNALKLDGILCVDGLPTLYLTIRPKPVSAKEGANFQRLFWNQGLATVLVVVDTETVRIYSGLMRPANPNALEQDNSAVVEAISLADYALKLRTFLIELATGRYYQRAANREHFNRGATVDAYLLNNLRDLSERLVDSERQLDIRTSHSFIARILFVCYLTDRGIIDLGDFPECCCKHKTKLGDMLAGLRTVEAKQRALHGLFEKLKEDFNGSMFEPATLAECRLLGQKALTALTDFLQGNELGTGQYTLDFWAYDFQFIPVETISAIYEVFLKAEDEQGKRDKGAYYTPRFMAETVVDLALPMGESYEGKRFLDPACGSGIFLVSLFNRLASRWMADHFNASYDRKAEALKTILRDQLCGIDVNPTACRIACFSLYLAFLGCFDPPDIKGYIKRKGRLPSILKPRDAADSTPLTFPVIYEDDFLFPSNTLPDGFDVAVGNPPWSARGAEKGLHHLFALKISKHLATGGMACILLPSKTFLNDKTNRFQEKWLRSVTVEEVVQLADYRKILFQDAMCPCMIVRFRAVEPDIVNATVEYVTPKVTQIDHRDGIIPVSPGDRKTIPLRRLLAAASQDLAPAVWKQYLWGTPCDLKFLDLLRQMPRLSDIAGAPGDNKRWIKGQGFIPSESMDKSRLQPRPWKNSALFVDANKLAPIVLLPQDCKPIGERFKYMHRTRDEKVFQPPRVLISQGVGKIGFLNVAYSDFPAVFRHGLQAISGPPEDEDLLLFLTVYLRSKLARYFLFHTSANWGTERDKVLFTELLQIPLPLPGSDYVHRDASRIVRKVASRIRDFRERVAASMARDAGCLFKDYTPAERYREAAVLQNEMDPLIYQYFDLLDQEIILVEDTVKVVIPSATPGDADKAIPTCAPIHKNREGIYTQGLNSYATTLGDTLNAWARDAGSEVRVSLVGGVHEQTGLACVTAQIAKRPAPFDEVALSDETFLKIAGLAESAAVRKGCLEYMRGVIVFLGTAIHIFKPVALVGWTRTAALNDAAEIYSRIAQSRSTFKEVRV